MTEKDMETIKDLLSKAVTKAYTAGKRAAKDPYRQTERRLRAYPVLKRNVERYKADIEDIKREDFGKSQSLVLFRRNSGQPPKKDLEEIREEKILEVRVKLERDEKEIREIETALEYVEGWPYYEVIEMIYFRGLGQLEVEARLHCDRSTVYRNRKILVSRISEALYGADAL